MYEPRLYRNLMEGDRFRSFQVIHLETDVWIGVNPSSFNDSMIEFATSKIIGLRKMLDDYILNHPDFQSSLLPLPNDEQAPEPIREMIRASQKSNTGPMSAVAGLFAQFIGEAIQHEFVAKEIVVENGGDIYLNVISDIDISIYAGKSPLSNCIAVQIPASESPLGICTSSGTVGHSLSFGKSDAVAISCKNTAVADAWATRLGNEVKSEADIEQALAVSAQVPEILSTLIIVGDKMGVHGKFKIKPVITQ